MVNSEKGLLNLLIGIILMIVGVAWYFVRIPYVSSYVYSIDLYPFYEILVLFIVGLFGVCIFFIGLVLAWMGWDDYKMSKEEAEDEEEPYGEEAVEEEEPGSKEKELEAELRKEMETRDQIVCEVCGKVVKTKAGLSAHMRTHK